MRLIDRLNRVIRLVQHRPNEIVHRAVDHDQKRFTSVSFMYSTCVTSTPALPTSTRPGSR